MKKRDFSQLKPKAPADLLKLVNEKKKDLTALAGGLVEKSGRKNVKKTRNLRREIAQILTLIREKEISQEEEVQK